MTTNSEVIAFPAKNRIANVKRCATMLDRLHGVEANDFWRRECRELAAYLTGLGYEDAAMRREVMEFQNAVQAELWAGMPRPRRAATAIEALKVSHKSRQVSHRRLFCSYLFLIRMRRHRACGQCRRARAYISDQAVPHANRTLRLSPSRRGAHRPVPGWPMILRHCHQAKWRG